MYATSIPLVTALFDLRQGNERGASYGLASGLTISIFEDQFCEVGYGSAILVYREEETFFGDWTYVKAFPAFKMSRPLGDREQLDISTWGQDEGQPDKSYCGAFVKSFQSGATDACHNVFAGTVVDA